MTDEELQSLEDRFGPRATYYPTVQEAQKAARVLLEEVKRLHAEHAKLTKAGSELRGAWGVPWEFLTTQGKERVKAALTLFLYAADRPESAIRARCEE